MPYNNEISITAHNAETEKDRINRLHHVVGYLAALADHYGNSELLNKISKLHDHKGELIVTWESKPTLGELEFTTKAWESTIGDGSNNITHEYQA